MTTRRTTMSDTFDMYEQDPEQEVAAAPKSSSVLKIDPLGAAARITVDGQELLVATPLMIQQLQQQLVRADTDIRDLKNKCLRLIEQVSLQQTQIQQLRKELSTKVSYD